MVLYDDLIESSILQWTALSNLIQRQRFLRSTRGGKSPSIEAKVNPLLSVVEVEDGCSKELRLLFSRAQS